MSRTAIASLWPIAAFHVVAGPHLFRATWHTPPESEERS
jgi:hypothetical protein